MICQVHTKIFVAVKTVLISDAIVVARKRCCGAEASAKDANPADWCMLGVGKGYPNSRDMLA